MEQKEIEKYLEKLGFNRHGIELMIDALEIYRPGIPMKNYISL